MPRRESRRRARVLNPGENPGMTRRGKINGGHACAFADKSAPTRALLARAWRKVSLADAEVAFSPHVVDFQSTHGGPATRLDLFLDPNTKRVPL